MNTLKPNWNQISQVLFQDRKDPLDLTPAFVPLLESPLLEKPDMKKWQLSSVQDHLSNENTDSQIHMLTKT